jgi:TIR domain
MEFSAPFFLSYAHADAADVARFREVLEPLLKSSSTYRFSDWSDHLILPGEPWRSEIARALEQCRFGLLLVSPNFLASPFITSEEMPVLLAKPMVVPVALHRISFDGVMDLKGLAERQVFRDSKGRTFDACGRKQGRRDFAMELFQKINLLLEKYKC